MRENSPTSIIEVTDSYTDLALAVILNTKLKAFIVVTMCLESHLDGLSLL